LIDAGAHHMEKKFRKGLEKAGVKPEEIRLLLLTHGHFDHIGGAKAIKAITGCRIALHASEKEWLEKSLKPMPPASPPGGASCAGHNPLFAPGENSGSRGGLSARRGGSAPGRIWYQRSSIRRATLPALYPSS
jgi:glyoxylase-like metal-dependent hydrolase (beta-lactamase superfamily II)